MITKLLSILPARLRALHRGRVMRVLLAGAALLGTSCSTLSSRSVRDPAPAVARLRAGGSLEDEVKRLTLPLVNSGELCGVAVGVLASDMKPQVFGFGATEQPRNRAMVGPPQGDTIFQIGSVSKLFVNALLARLIAEQKLSYDDTARSIIPANIPLSEDAGTLTIYELATNTGGLPRQHNDFTQLRYFISYLLTGRNLYGCVTRESLYKYLKKYKRHRKKKGGYVYSNLGYGLLTHLIELKTGHSISKLLQEKICRPLGLRDTVLHLNLEQRSRLATGHPGDQPKFKSRRTPMEPWDMGEILGASCGLHSTVNDLLVFARANLGQKKHPLEPHLLSLQHFQVRTPNEEHGSGWSIQHLHEGQEALIYKQGMVSGYSAYIGLNTRHQIAVVVLYNNFFWREKVGHNLLLRILEARSAEHSVGISSPPSLE
jgi:CubicO group peptidase (beta-lactamase class C family)